MERTSKAVETRCKREHGGAQCASDQVGCVCADVPSLVIRVDGQVQAHQLDKVIIITIAELVGQVEAVILVLLNWSNLSILEYVAVDLGCDGRQFGYQVHGILEGVLPVLFLVDAFSIGLGENGLVFESGDSEGELGHRVQSGRAAIDQLLNELGQIGASGPICREGTNLLFAGDFTGQEQPEKTC